MRFHTLLTKVQPSVPECEILRGSTEKCEIVQQSGPECKIVQKLPRAIDNDH